LRRIATFAVIGLSLSLGPAVGQRDEDAGLADRLAVLFPDAVSFSDKEGDPPHYRAYGAGTPGEDAELLGLAFWTTELDPLERGYDGPIQMLVGMDTTGVLTRIIVTNHREPYGYFSVDLPAFEEQFERKNIRDRFRVGEDVDAISRATITVRSASRAVRNSARRAARAYLTPPEQ
jgi:NosR/NirI family nitrous oxide reductase transcriptional regulator